MTETQAIIDQPALMETPSNHEQLTDPEKWLNFAANHPGKLAMLIIMSEARVPLSKTQLDIEVDERTEYGNPYGPGTVFGWGATMTQTPGVRNTTTTAIVSMHPREVSALETTVEGDEQGTSLAGLLIDWQIRHPELPLQKLLGSSSSKVKGVYAPTLRMLMFADLVDQHDSQTGPSINGLALDAPASNNARQQAVTVLALEGFVDFKSQQAENRREFRILDPEYKRSARGPRFENLKPETRIMYRTLEAAKSIREVWLVDEFLRLANVLTDSIPEAEMKKVRTRLQQSLAPSRKEMVGVVEPISGQLYEGMSLVKLKPELVKPVAELVQLFDGFAGGDPEVLARGRQLADELYKNPAALSWALRYAHEVSSHTDFDQQKMQHILEIIGRQPELTTREIMGQYRNSQGRRVGHGAIRASINGAQRNGRVQSHPEKASAIKDKKTLVHSITAEDE